MFRKLIKHPNRLKTKQIKKPSMQVINKLLYFSYIYRKYVNNKFNTEKTYACRGFPSLDHDTFNGSSPIAVHVSAMLVLPTVTAIGSCLTLTSGGTAKHMHHDIRHI